jgi:CubicO group peptidase (beta-lactamase class C family)
MAEGAMTTAVSGDCDERFAAVRQVLADNLTSGADLGASVAVYVDGQPVVDIWGGWADAARTRPWERDTLVNVWSTTKTMTALSALMLADTGDLDFSAPVSTYWPEFAAAGKEAVLVRHLLGHTAGLSGWTEPMELQDLYDWEKATSLLAAQEPWWQPGTASGYHAVTQGYLVGEVVRRVSGQSLGEFFAKELAGPLGADFHIGLDPADDGRVAEMIPPPTLSEQMGDLPQDSVVRRTFVNPVVDARVTADRAWRAAEIPAANGQGNARSVAAVQSVLACAGEVPRADGPSVRLLSEAGCKRVFDEQSNGDDLVLGIPVRFGMGYGLASERMPLGPHTAFWGGWGGSVIVVDQDLRLAVAYVMNRMEAGLVGDNRGLGVVMEAVTAALGG